MIEAGSSKCFDSNKCTCLVNMVTMIEQNKLLNLMTIDKWLKPAVQKMLIRTSVSVSMVLLVSKVTTIASNKWMNLMTSVSVSMGLLVSKVKTIASNKWMNLMTIDKWLKPMVLISDKRVVALISNKRVEYLVNGKC